MTISGSDIPRFSEPQSFYEPDASLEGVGTWLQLTDVNIRYVLSIPEVQVYLVGADNEDGFETIEVKVDVPGGWAKLDYQDPFHRIIWDEIDSSISREMAAEALREAL